MNGRAARAWIAGAALALAAAAAGGAETVSLDEAVARALAADQRIGERRHLVEAARALLQEALGHRGLRYDVNAFVGIAPGVDGGFFEAPNGKSCTSLPCTPRDDLYELNDGLSPWVSVQFKIIKPLYTFGKIERYAEAAQGNVDVKRQDVRLARAEVRWDVTRAYYGYLAARDMRRLLEDVDRRIGKALHLVERWLKEGGGRAKRSDLYALQTGQALARRFLAQARGVEAVALDGLKVLTGSGLDAELAVADRELRPVPLPEGHLRALIARALERRPEMAQLEAGMRARRALVAARKAEAKPNVYAGVVGSLAWSPNRDRLDNPYLIDPFNHAGATPVLGLKWEFASGVQPARVARARAELEALVAKASFAREGIPFQVAEAWHKVRAGRRQVEELERASRAARRWLITTYADFEAGLERTERLVDAFQAYVFAHSDYLTAVHDYDLAVAHLERVTGAWE